MWIKAISGQKIAHKDNDVRQSTQQYGDLIIGERGAIPYDLLKLCKKCKKKRPDVDNFYT